MTRPQPTLALVLALLLAACAHRPPSPPAAPPSGLLDVADRPAERALLAGIRAYDDAQYPEAEKQFRQALAANLASPRDRAAAHKHLAFIACTSNRMAECEAAFRAARQSDPGFALSKSEAGHPLWGPVYKRLQP
jgi:Tfp pilus assembly protein PilF